jgi:hypothetical protein
MICTVSATLAGASRNAWSEVVLPERLLIRCRPDFTNTEPAANIGPFPQWADKKKIVSMDPLGHLAPWLFKDTIEKENGR